MSKNTRWTSADFKKPKLIDTGNGNFKPSNQLLAKNVSKLPNLLERAIGEPKQPKNAKIRNATKVEVDGVKFASKLEKYMYDLLIGAGIPFEFQKTFILQEKFRYRDENIRAITKICDFYLPTKQIIIETKGYASDISPMKHKMLKLALKRDYGIEPEILMPATKKDCELVLNRLKYEL